MAGEAKRRSATKRTGATGAAAAPGHYGSGMARGIDRGGASDAGARLARARCRRRMSCPLEK
eukprot:5437161-Heterocapsa_arctica.AAC.1